MGDTKERLLPGTAVTYPDSAGGKGFSKIEMLISATGGLSLSQVCAVTGLEGSTIQNWVKRGWVTNPRGKKYDEIHIARILIINALKDCIKLEHISILMKYVNDPPTEGIVKESDLFNFLCDALAMMGQADDLSKGGVESVVEAVVKDYEDSPVYEKIRKALAVMIYACVCTDVKRRTESMMDEVLSEYRNPKIEETAETAEASEIADTPVEEVSAIADTPPEEISDATEETSGEPIPDTPAKQSNRPWYFRRGSKT
ncbi:MAG: DUF1836 domain-containing protein [Oscillospiraceae bacterium]|nr:DUF1836 domain-containing protein [Oscillospiraceae bacterium]